MPNAPADFTQAQLYSTLVLASALLAACAQSAPADPRPASPTEEASHSPLAAADRRASECIHDDDCDGIDARCEPHTHACTVRCPSIVIQTAADIAAARRCHEIDGDLRIAVTSPLAIEPSDLPDLARITGNFFSIGGQPLTEITLSALQEVGTEEKANSLIEISLDGDHLRRVSLPRLEKVHGALSLFGLYALVELELPALQSVDQLSLINLQRLESLSLPGDVQATQPLDFEYLCALPAGDLAADGGVHKAIGCCTESSVDCDTTACKCDWAAEARP